MPRAPDGRDNTVIQAFADESVKQPTRSIVSRELKLLWAGAAGLCSFPECKTNLVRLTRKGTAFHIGESAHMKPYSLAGPRAKRRMSPAKLNCYRNLILLCGRCHSLIDKNVDDYPIPVLRRFKVQHERWVAESLNANASRIGPSAKFYRALIDRIERELQLDGWPWLIDHLWRDLLPVGLLDRGTALTAIYATTLWPRTRPKLEKAIKAVLAAWIEYCRHFESFSEPSRSGKFFVRDHAYQGASGYVRYQFDVKADNWSEKNRRLLIEYVRLLNRLVDAVCNELNPVYRQYKGYFAIPGVSSGDRGETFMLVPRQGSRGRRQSRGRAAAASRGSRRASPQAN